MAVKVFFLLCVEAVFAQTAYSQCIGGRFPGPGGLGWGYDGLPYDSMDLLPFDGYGVGVIDSLNVSPFDSPYGSNWPAGFGGLNPFASGPNFPGQLYGGGMPQACGPSIPPASLSVISENYIEGTVSVAGQLPFIASVSVSGEFPTVGAGAVSYGCGDGAVRIVGEGPIIASSFIPATPVIDPIDYTGLYPYGPSFVEDYRWPGPYTGPDCGPIY